MLWKDSFYRKCFGYLYISVTKNLRRFEFFPLCSFARALETKDHEIFFSIRGKTREEEDAFFLSHFALHGHVATSTRTLLLPDKNGDDLRPFEGSRLGHEQMNALRMDPFDSPADENICVIF